MNIELFNEVQYLLGDGVNLKHSLLLFDLKPREEEIVLNTLKKVLTDNPESNEKLEIKLDEKGYKIAFFDLRYLRKRGK